MGADEHLVCDRYLSTCQADDASGVVVVVCDGGSGECQSGDLGRADKGLSHKLVRSSAPVAGVMTVPRGLGHGGWEAQSH